jgi:hypothetical protein
LHGGVGMNNPSEGRSTRLAFVESLTLTLGECTQVKTLQAFPLSVSLDYFPFCKGDDEEPDTPAFVELLSANVLGPLYLTNYEGISCSIDNRADILSLLSDEAYDKLASAVSARSTCYGFDGKAVTL